MEIKLIQNNPVGLNLFAVQMLFKTSNKRVIRVIYSQTIVRELI